MGSPHEVNTAGSYKGAIYFLALTPTGTVLQAKLWGGPNGYSVDQTSDQGLGYALAVTFDHNRDGVGPDVISGQPLETLGMRCMYVCMCTCMYMSGSKCKWWDGGFVYVWIAVRWLCWAYVCDQEIKTFGPAVSM